MCVGVLGKMHASFPRCSLRVRIARFLEDLVQASDSWPVERASVY